MSRARATPGERLLQTFGVRPLDPETADVIRAFDRIADAGIAGLPAEVEFGAARIRVSLLERGEGYYVLRYDVITKDGGTP